MLVQIWGIVKLILTFNQADVFVEPVVPQVSFQNEKLMVVLVVVCRCIGGFLDDLGDPSVSQPLQ